MLISSIMKVFGVVATFLNSSTNGAWRAVDRNTEKGNKLHSDFTRHRGKPPVTRNIFFYCVYLTSKPPCRWNELIFQFTRPNFPPQTRPFVRSKGLRRTTNRTLTSPGIVAGLPLQQTQFFIAFIKPGSTHAAGTSWYFR